MTWTRGCSQGMPLSAGTEACTATLVCQSTSSLGAVDHLHIGQINPKVVQAVRVDVQLWVLHLKVAEQ